MSALIENVARAIKAATAGTITVSDATLIEATMDTVRNAQARAAVRAVADWLQADGGFYAGIIGVFVEKQLKDDSQ